MGRRRFACRGGQLVGIVLVAYFDVDYLVNKLRGEVDDKDLYLAREGCYEGRSKRFDICVGGR